MAINYSRLPDNAARDGVRLYVEEGRPVGSWLRSVLENDFVQAHLSADAMNAVALNDWAAFLFWDAPANSWGSAKVVDAWVKHHGLAGRQKGERT